MLSTRESSLPLAIIRNQSQDYIIYYHPDENKEVKRFPKQGFNLTDEEIDDVYRIVEGHKSAIYPEKYLAYYEKAKADYRLQKAKEYIVESPLQLFPIPQEIEGQRQSGLITGISGAGKSVFASQYAMLYHKMFPKNGVFLISKKDSDPAFEALKFIVRIPLDEEFLECDMDTSDFKDSLVIFDDIENIKDKEIKTKVYKLKDNLAETGRSENVYLLTCNHVAMNGKETRVDLNECDFVVVFKSGSAYHNENLLNKYVGLSKPQIKKIFEIKSRWYFVKKTDPMYVISENKIMLL